MKAAVIMPVAPPGPGVALHAGHALAWEISAAHLRTLRTLIGSAGTMSDAEQALLEVRGKPGHVESSAFAGCSTLLIA